MCRYIPQYLRSVHSSHLNNNSNNNNKKKKNINKISGDDRDFVFISVNNVLILCFPHPQVAILNQT